MKTKRSITIYIEKPGAEAFEPSKYLQCLIKDPQLALVFFKDGTILSSSASWHGAPPLCVLYHHFRVAVKICAKALYRKVETIFANIVVSKR